MCVCFHVCVRETLSRLGSENPLLANTSNLLYLLVLATTAVSPCRSVEFSEKFSTNLKVSYLLIGSRV